MTEPVVHKNERNREKGTTLCGAPWAGALVSGDPKSVTCTACKEIKS